MRKVVLESPYAGNVEKNIAYAKLCLLDSINRGESPIASHLLYTQVLDDKNKEERKLGINCGLAWLESADEQVFYIDYGMSEGMLMAFDYAVENNINFSFRTIDSTNKFYLEEIGCLIEKNVVNNIETKSHEELGATTLKCIEEVLTKYNVLGIIDIITE